MVTETQVKTGYKQTDVGTIPTDWNLVKLSDGCSKLNVGFVGTCEPFYTENPNSVLLIRTGNLDDGDFTLEDSKYVTEEFHRRNKKSQVKTGDLLIARHGESGMAVLVPDYIQQANTLNIVILRTKKETLNNIYTKYAINSNIVRKQVQNKTAGSTQGVINTGEIAGLLIPAPDIKEQEILANTLEDIDILIHKLNQLIEKKRDIKQGTMQELLTGKRRLPGFHSEWETNKIGSIIDLEKGKQLSRWYLTETGDYPVWNGGTEPSGYTTSWNTENDSITISEGGNSCGFVNYCEERFWRGGHCYLVNLITDSLIYTFLYHLLKYKESSIMNLRVGSGLPNIQKKELDNFELNYPKDKREQEEISKALSNMEKELELLENQKSKYLDIKQGMMQQLLTGRIRLV